MSHNFHIKSPKEIRTAHSSRPNTDGNFWSNLFEQKKDKIHANPSLIKQRKAPIKVEPKVFFANERTFLAWLHISIILAGGSIAILALADQQNPSSQIYGIILLPVSVAFIVYAMYQCKQLREWLWTPYS
jgi:hypothetical protein